MARSPEDGAAVVAAFYEAAADPTEWPQAWTVLAKALGASSATLYLEPAKAAAPIFLAMPGWSEEAFRRYADYYNAVDPYAAFGRRHLSMEASLGPEMVSHATYEASEVWHDFARPLMGGAFHFIAAAIPVRDELAAKLALHRPRDAADFDEADRVWLSGMLLHLRGALRLQVALQSERLLASARSNALDSLETGVVVLGLDGNVLLANRPAEQLCRVSGILLRTGSGLTLRSPALNARFQALVADAAAGGPGGSLLIGGGMSPTSPVVATVAPFSSSLARSILGEGAASWHGVLLTLRGPGRADEQTALLMRSCGLTPAEADVALALSAGATVAAVAAARGRSIFTVRAQVRSILDKTQARNLRDLGRIVAGLA